MAGCLALGACSPALDWRELRPHGTHLLAMFPCKPSVLVRSVGLVGRSVPLSLHACAAAGSTWGLAHADVADPALLDGALRELRMSAVSNIGATTSEPQAMQVPGATPHAASARLRLEGHRPDGKIVQMQVAVFAHGTRVFQATVLAERVSDDASDSFFSGLRFSP